MYMLDHIHLELIHVLVGERSNPSLGRVPVPSCHWSDDFASMAQLFPSLITMYMYMYYFL